MAYYGLFTAFDDIHDVNTPTTFNFKYMMLVKFLEIQQWSAGIHQFQHATANHLFYDLPCNETVL